MKQSSLASPGVLPSTSTVFKTNCMYVSAASIPRRMAISPAAWLSWSWSWGWGVLSRMQVNAVILIQVSQPVGFLGSLGPLDDHLPAHRCQVMLFETHVGIAGIRVP